MMIVADWWFEQEIFCRSNRQTSPDGPLEYRPLRLILERSWQHDDLTRRYSVRASDRPLLILALKIFCSSGHCHQIQSWQHDDLTERSSVWASDRLYLIVIRKISRLNDHYYEFQLWQLAWLEHAISYGSIRQVAPDRHTKDLLLKRSLLPVLVATVSLIWVGDFLYERQTGCTWSSHRRSPA